MRAFLDKRQLAGLSNAETADAIKVHFKRHFNYSLEQSQIEGKQTALSNFLLVSRAGHCEFFATATVMLLRQAGIPARYATGYSASEYSRLEQCIVVRARHAHAWAIAYIDGVWLPVDSTPASWQTIEEQQSSVLSPLLDVFRWMGFRFSLWRTRLDIGVLSGHWGWIAAPLLIIFLIRFVHRRRTVVMADHRSKGNQAEPQINGLNSPYYALQSSFARNGWPRHVWEPAGEWVTRLANTGLNARILSDLDKLVRQHYRLRFHPQGLTPDEKTAMDKDCHHLIEQIEHTMGTLDVEHHT